MWNYRVSLIILMAVHEHVFGCPDIPHVPLDLSDSRCTAGEFAGGGGVIGNPRG